MKDFKSLRADHAEVQRAVQALTRGGPDMASKVLPLVEALAAVDGRVTPKERERLDEVAAWIRTSA